MIKYTNSKCSNHRTEKDDYIELSLIVQSNIFIVYSAYYIKQEEIFAIKSK